MSQTPLLCQGGELCWSASFGNSPAWLHSAAAALLGCASRVIETNLESCAHSQAWAMPYYNPRHANNKTGVSCVRRTRERRFVCDIAVAASRNAGALEAGHRRSFGSDTKESSLTGRTDSGLS